MDAPITILLGILGSGGIVAIATLLWQRNHYVATSAQESFANVMKAYSKIRVTIAECTRQVENEVAQSGLWTTQKERFSAAMDRLGPSLTEFGISLGMYEFSEPRAIRTTEPFGKAATACVEASSVVVGWIPDPSGRPDRFVSIFRSGTPASAVQGMKSAIINYNTEMQNFIIAAAARRSSLLQISRPFLALVATIVVVGIMFFGWVYAHDVQVLGDRVVVLNHFTGDFTVKSIPTNTPAPPPQIAPPSKSP